MKIVLLLLLFLSTILANIGAIERVKGDVKLSRFNKELKSIEKFQVELSLVDRDSYIFAQKILSTPTALNAIENINRGIATKKDLLISNREDLQNAFSILKKRKRFSLLERDVIEVGDKSSAILRFKDNTKINLGSNSKVKIFKYRDGKNSTFKMSILKGSFKINVGSKANKPEKFVIKTNNALIYPTNQMTIFAGALEESEKIYSLRGATKVVTFKKDAVVSEKKFIEVSPNSKLSNIKTYKKSSLKKLSLFKERKSINVSFKLDDTVIQYKDLSSEESLFKATLANNIELVKASLKEININKEEALLVACVYGYSEIVEVLLESGANPNYIHEDWTALMYAKQFGHIRVIDSLIRYGAVEVKETQYRKDARTLLLAELGKLEQVKELINQGVDPNSRYSNTKSTIIIEAVKSGNRELIDFLIEKNADEHIVDIYGLNALDYAEALEMKIVTKRLFLNSN